MIDNLNDPEKIKLKLADLEVLNELRKDLDNKGKLGYLLLIYAILMINLGDTNDKVLKKINILFQRNHYSTDLEKIKLVLDKI